MLAYVVYLLLCCLEISACCQLSATCHCQRLKMRNTNPSLGCVLSQQLFSIPQEGLVHAILLMDIAAYELVVAITGKSSQSA